MKKILKPFKKFVGFPGFYLPVWGWMYVVGIIALMLFVGNYGAAMGIFLGTTVLIIVNIACHRLG